MVQASILERDRQAEPRAARRAGASGVGAPEPGEDVGRLTRPQTDAVVLDDDRHGIRPDADVDVDGSTLTVTDTGSIPAYLACPAGQEGTYEVDFPGGCDTLSVTELDEPCAGRRVALDGFQATRQ